MRFEYHPGVENDLFNITAWYDAQSPGLGDALVQELRDFLALIGDAPLPWPHWPGSPDAAVPVRKVVLSRFDRYGIAYQAFDDHVLVLCVVAFNMEPFYWVGRTDG